MTVKQVIFERRLAVVAVRLVLGSNSGHFGAIFDEWRGRNVVFFDEPNGSVKRVFIGRAKKKI